MQPANANLLPAATQSETEASAPFHETVTLQRIVAPVSEEEFRARYWERKPLIIHRGNPDYYGNLFTLQDFDEWSRAGRGYVKTAEATAKVQAKHGSSAEAIEKLLTEIRDGHTLILDGVQEFEPRLGMLCRKLGQETAARFQTNIYLTPPQGKGFTPHWDNHDVFIMQVLGSKHWKVEKNRRTLPAKDGTMAEDREIKGEFYSFTLQQGDMLYMPRGFVHAAECGLESSMHITMGMYPDTWDQLIGAAVKAAINRDDSLRLALPFGYMKGDGAGLINRVAEELRKLADPEFLALVLDEFRDEAIKRAQQLDISGAITTAYRKEPLSAGDKVGARPALIFRKARHPEAVTLKVGTRAITFPDFFAPALDFALATPDFAVRDLPGDLEDEEKIVFIERLIQEGLILRK